ncbi:MAG TPA: hypothetical protein VML53_00505 [Thermoplasmata archaeon]|nr:hypothetical protein [Thermoplasmata archaeon]
MTADPAAAADSIVLPRRTIERDLRTSLLLFGGGVVVTVVGYVLEGTGVWPVAGPYHGGFWYFLPLLFISTGQVLVFVGVVFAIINWLMLRGGRRRSPI